MSENAVMDEPQAPAAEPEQRQEPKIGGRYRDLFEQITFQTSASGKVYPNSDGSQSRKIAAGLCVVRGGFMGVSFNVYARKAPGKNGKITADVSFVGTRAQQAISPLDERSKQEFSEFKGWLSAEFTKWRKAQQVAPTVPTNKLAAELDEDAAAGLFDE